MKPDVDTLLSSHFELSRHDSPSTTKHVEGVRNIRYSTEAACRELSTLKRTAAKIPVDTISLAIGRPRWDLYPWTSGQLSTTTAPSGPHPSDIVSDGEAMPEDGSSDFVSALNYATAAGLPKLVDFVTEHVRNIHNPPYADWECCITCGTTSALEILLRMFCNRGDSILTEQFTYTGLIEAARPMGVRIRGIEMDAEGLLPDALDRCLSMWDHGDGPKPYLLYTIPTGQNPTGTTQPAERRKEIYEVAERRDLLIIEDDPYYFLQLEGTETEEKNAESARKKFLATLPPSYLSLDKSGRVMRLDATSKILAPGLRLGWLTACSEIMEKFLTSSELSTVSPSGPSQLMLCRLLVKQWGHDGFIDWLIWLCGQYRLRRDRALAACERWLPRDVCTWSAPTAGMFIWVQIRPAEVLLSRYRAEVSTGMSAVSTLEDAISSRALEYGVLVSKGRWFQTTPDKDVPTVITFRLTFAAAAVEQLEEGVRRFGIALQRVVDCERA